MKHIWRKAQRMLAGVLSVTMLASLLAGVPSLRAEAAPTSETEVLFGENGQEYTVEGTNDVGNLLAEEITSTQEEQIDGAGYSIYNIDVQENVATVEYAVAEDCTLVIAVYEEESGRMAASGSAEISAEVYSAEVTIETDAMPEYFVVKAYMIDSINMKPLRTEYSSSMYTRDMQALLAATVDDFDPDRVLNLDEDKTTNFMVYSEDTILIEADEDTNVVTAQGEDSDVYVVENIDENIENLSAGDIVSIGNGDDVTILKIASITVDGTTATIVEEEVEIGEVFECVKIENEANSKSAEFDESTCGEGVTYLGQIEEGPEVVQAKPEVGGSIYLDGTYDEFELFVDPEGGASLAGGAKFGIEIESPDNNKGLSGSISGDVSIGLTVDLSFYITAGKQVLEFYVGATLAGNIEVEGSWTKTVTELARVTIPTIPCVNIALIPKVVFKISGSLEFHAAVSGKIGIKYDSTAIHSMEIVKEFGLDTLEASASVTVGFGLAFEPAINIVSSKIAEAGLEVEAMVEGKVSVSTSFMYGHSCAACLSADLGVSVNVSPEVKILTFPIPIEASLTVAVIDLGECYYSFTYKEFGWGECPYKDKDVYNADIIVQDKKGNPLKGVTVVIEGRMADGNIYHEEYTTGESGVLSVGIAKGTDYTITGTKDLYHKSVRRIRNWDRPKKIDPLRLYEYEQIISTPIVVGDGTALDTSYNRSYIKKLVIENDDFTVTGYPFNNSEIENVVIKDGVTIIPENLFHGCTIRKISVPDSIVEIGEYAFSQATLPKNFKLGTGVQTIGQYAFSHCDAEGAEFVFTEGMTLGLYAFYYADWGNVYVDSVTDVTLSTPFYDASLEAVYISQEVTVIPGGMFTNATIGKIEIPDTITEIKADAFSGTEVLYDFAMGSGVETFGVYAFYGAVLPESFALGENVKTVGYRAFYGTKGTISKLVVSEGMTIGESAFYEAQIKELVLNSENVSVASTWEKYTDNTDKSSFTMAVIEKVTISDEATGIPNYMFQGSQIKKITIPENIASIGIGAFYDTTLPENFRLGDGVETIGSWAFRFVELPTGFEINESVKTISQCAFEWCDGEIAKLVISEGMTLEVGAISSRVTIKELILADGTDVTIAVQNVDYGSALAGVTIKKVTISEEATNIPVRMFFGSTIEEIEIPDNITEIGGAAFYSATLPEGFELGTGVKAIGSSAFVGSNLEDATIVINEGMTIEGSAFSGLPIKEVILNSGVDVAVGNPFAGATIGMVSFSEEVSMIPGNLFYDSTIEAIEMPDSITEIGESAFGSTTLPEDFELGAGVKTLGSYAFANSNWEVSEFVIDSGMTLESSAFAGLTIQKIILNSGAEVVSPMPFRGTTIEAVSISGEADSIPAQLFRESTINSIVIPSNVTAIGDYAFYYTTLPSDFTVSDSVSVGSNAFTGSTYTYVAPETVETTTVQAPEAIIETVGVVELPEALAGNVRTAEVLTKDNTASFTDLRPNATYNFYAVKVNADFMTTEEILAADNLLYITQVTTDETGAVTVSYTPKEEYEDVVEFVTWMSQIDISDAEIVLENIFYDGNAHEVAPQVTYAGQILTQSEDYEVSGDYVVTETGVYSATIRGINDYCGVVTMSFRVVTEDPVTALALDKQTATLKEGESTTLAVSYTPATTYQVDVIWSGSDETVATVENGVVTAVGKGTATITVTSVANAELTASCVITVVCGHASKTEVPEQTSTCMEKGWDAYKKCECGQLFNAKGEEINAIPYRALAACDYNTDEWGYREDDGHAHVCRVEGCGKHEMIVGHTPNIPAATTEEAQICSICGYVIEEALEQVIENPFGDVKESDWFYPYVVFAYKYNLMGGKGTMPDGSLKFDPSNTITRAEFVTMLYSKEGKPAVEYTDIFDDVVDEKWYTDAILWAAEEEIVGGKKPGYFDVNGKITRQEIALILYKYALYKGYDTEELVNADFSGFADTAKIATWAETGMKWAVKYKVIGGKNVNGETLLSPGGNATRAESATMMKAFMGAYEGITE